MNPVLFLGLVIILNAALPWWPYTAFGRLRHHRPWDWVMKRPAQQALKKAAMKLRAMQCDTALQRQFAEYDTMLQMFAERWAVAESSRRPP